MKLNANEIVTQRHKRAYIQFGGARPGNKPAYAGQDGQYMIISGVSVPEAGGVDPIWVPDPRRSGSYRLVGRKFSPPDLASATVEMLEKRGGIPRQLGKIGCQFNLYEVTGACKDLSDILRGWSDYVLVYSGAIVTDKDFGDRMAWDGDEQIVDSLSVTLADVYPVGAMVFGAKAADNTDTEVLDVCYAGSFECDDCSDAATQRIYSLVKTDATTTPAHVVYSLDGGDTSAISTVTGLALTEAPVAIRVIGEHLVVFSPTAGSATLSGYYVATLNAAGVPGTWSKITTGFVSTHLITDVHVAGPRDIFLTASGGYIYRIDDILSGADVADAGVATTANLTRIDGHEHTLLAVGATDTVVRSVDRGQTWSTVASTGAGGTLSAVQVLDEHRYWVASATTLWSTVDGATSWSGQVLAGITAIQDILFATDEVGFVAASTSTPAARIYGTFTGGANWDYQPPRFLNLPTFNRANRLAVPDVDDASITANTLAVAGLASGTAGRLLVAAATRI